MEDKLRKLWGMEMVELSPVFFNAMRLKYALGALEGATGRVLEVGSGAGAFVRAIKKYRPELTVVGSDIDAKLVKLAKKMDKENEYKQADVNKLPFEDESVGAIVAFDVIEHLDDPSKAFSEMYRVIKPGGVVHAAIPLERGMLTLHGLMLKLGVKPKEEYAGHIKRFDVSQIKKLLKQVGFRKIESSFSGHYIYQLIDFSYFSLLSLLGKQVSHTVEGYEVGMRKGLRQGLLSNTRALLASLCYFESSLLPMFPGVIGHFTGKKVGD